MTQEQDGRKQLVLKISRAMADGKDSGGYSTLLDMYAHIALKVIEESTPSPEAMREALAQIISPEVFNKEYELCHPDRARIEQFSAVKKADAVLAALRSSPQTEREGAAQQAQAET